MSNFHGRLMNIPQPIGFRGDYYEGHRDARHAAAEIGLEADAEIDRLLAALGRIANWTAGVSAVVIARDALGATDSASPRENVTP